LFVFLFLFLFCLVEQIPFFVYICSKLINIFFPMKKNLTLLAVFMALFVFTQQSFAQKAQSLQHKTGITKTDASTNDLNFKSLIKKHASQSTNTKANTSILTQDFSSTTFPPTGWTNTVVSGTATLKWTRGTSLALAWDDLNDQGTTFAAGYAMVNSDGYGSGHPAENCALQSPVMNCSSYTNVWVSYNEYFRQYASSTGHLEYSINGTTWTSVYAAETGLAQDEATANPNMVDVNLPNAAGQAAVYIRFHWTGAYDYYWVVDDIKVYSRPANDMALTSYNDMNEYTCVPKGHYNNAPLVLAATAKNTGATSATNVNMSVNLYNLSTMALAYTGTSNTVATLAADATTLLSCPSFTVPSDTSLYYAEYIVHMQQTDPDHTNDTLYQGFWITDSLYARSDEMFTSMIEGALGYGAGGTLIVGNDFTLPVADKLTRIDAYVTAGRINDTTQVFVYSTDANGVPTTLLGSSAIYKFTTAGAQFVSLPISGGPLSLAAGNYFVGIKEFTTTPNLGIAYTANNFVPYKAFIKINAGVWDTLTNYGYNVAMVVEPYLVCTNYHNTLTANPSTPVCPGTQVALTSSPGSSFAWSPAVGTTQSVNVTPSSTTSYTVTTTNSNGCTASQSVSVTVNLAPAAFNVTGTGSYCAGAAGLPVGLSGSATGNNYQLQIGGVNTGSAVAGTGNAISFGNQTVAGTYTVIATNATTLCTSTMTGNAVITVNALPTANTVTGGGAYCSGGSGLPVGLSSSQTGVTYQLQLNSVNTGSPVSGSGSAITFGNQTVAGTYTVVATNTVSSCTAPMTGNVAITINPTPVANAGTDQSVTMGASTSLTGSASGTPNAVSYSWAPAASLVNANVQNPTTTNLTQTTVFVLTTTDQVTGCFDTDDVTVNVTGGVLSADCGASSTICAGASVQLSVLASGGTPPYNYAWTSVPVDPTLSGSSTLQNPLVTPTVNTVYSVTVTDVSTTASCATTITINSTIYSNVAVVDETDGNGNGSATANPTGGTPTYTYNWNTTPSQSTPAITGLHAGIYSVTITDAIGCVTDTTVIVNLVTGISTTTLSQIINVIPNPSNGNFIIQLDNYKDHSPVLSIVNIQGQTILSEEIHIDADKFNKNISMESFAKGMYYIKVIDQNDSRTFKLMIQ
jgi:hypothetical protein